MMLGQCRVIVDGEVVALLLSAVYEQVNVERTQEMPESLVAVLRIFFGVSHSKGTNKEYEVHYADTKQVTMRKKTPCSSIC